MALLGWSLKWEEEILSHLIECPNLPYHLVMNIIVWNCMGALKPNFQRYVSELVRTHNPTIGGHGNAGWGRQSKGDY